MRKPAKYLVQAVEDVINGDNVLDTAKLVDSHYHQCIEKREAHPIFNFSSTHTFFVMVMKIHTNHVLSLPVRKN